MNPSPASAPNLPRRVLCLGDMAADIFAGPMARLPGPGEVRLTDRIAFFPGGNALNTAVALRRLGEQVSFVGSVGEDAFGDLLLAQLARIGLDLRGVTREPGGVTPTTLIYRAEGEDRRFIHALGMADRFTGHPVPLELIPEDGVMLAGGYLKLRAWKHEALRETLRLARQRRCTTMLNVCIPEGDRVEAGVCLRLLPDVDVFLPNEDEARVLSGHSDPADQARVFRDAGVGLAIITRGARGLYAADARHSIHMGVFSVPMVDPSGCGDCFSAGLIAARLRRWELVRSLKLASAVGALGATTLGCTSGVPSFADAERFLLEHDAELPVDIQTIQWP